jgi:hypothetical protein
MSLIHFYSIYNNFFLSLFGESVVNLVLKKLIKIDQNNLKINKILIYFFKKYLYFFYLFFFYCLIIKLIQNNIDMLV